MLRFVAVDRFVEKRPGSVDNPASRCGPRGSRLWVSRRRRWIVRIEQVTGSAPDSRILSTISRFRPGRRQIPATGRLGAATRRLAETSGQLHAWAWRPNAPGYESAPPSRHLAG